MTIKLSLYWVKTVKFMAFEFLEICLFFCGFCVIKTENFHNKGWKFNTKLKT